MSTSLTPQQILQSTAQAQQQLQSGKPQLAVRSLRGVIDQAGRSLPTLVVYAQALSMLNQHERAADFYRRAVKLQPENPRLRTELALSLKHAGDPESALEQIQLARNGEPWFAKAVTVEAEVLIDLDRPAEALELIESFERSAPAEAKTAPSMAMLLTIKSRLAPKHLAPGAVLDDLQKCAADSAVHPKQRSLLLARAGEMLDKVGQHDEAMDAIASSKKLRAVPWDAEAHTERVRACVGAWTTESASELPSSSVDGSSMVFILGMPRSGSSLLEQMLARHPSIQALGERNEINFSAAAIQQPSPGELAMVTDTSVLTADQCQQCAQRIEASIQRLRLPETRLTLDKQPFNFFHIPLLARLLPGCKVLHTVREPRDVAVSYFMQWFMEDHGQANSMDTLGQYYRDYRAMMDAWQQLPAPNQRPEMIDVQYERVVSHPEEVMREVLGFLGLEFDSAVLDHTKTNRKIVTASRDQVKEGLYTSSLNRWKRYEEHLAPFVEHMRDYLDA